MTQFRSQPEEPKKSEPTTFGVARPSEPKKDEPKKPEVKKPEPKKEAPKTEEKSEPTRKTRLTVLRDLVESIEDDPGSISDDARYEFQALNRRLTRALAS